MCISHPSSDLAKKGPLSGMTMMLRLCASGYRIFYLALHFTLKNSYQAMLAIIFSTIH